MTSSVIFAFRWLDVLEKEFDNAFVDIDLTLNDLLKETENGELVEDSIPEYVENIRDKIKVICSAWAQLVHKSQTIFQSNCKLEAQLVDLKSDLIEAQAFKQVSEKEFEKIMIELHSSQLQLQKYKPISPVNESNSNLLISEPDLIKKKLDEELDRRFSKKNESMSLAMSLNEINLLKKENENLREQLIHVNSEVYGAKLAAKYLDKELAGRIQQIQLFSKTLKPDEHERLWNQLESEIYLHRHKTIIKACRGKRLLTQKSNKVESNLSKELSKGELNTNHLINSEIQAEKECKEVNETKKESNRDDLDLFKKSHDLTQIRSVFLRRNDSKEGLGISITGGSEHGVPILISEIHENGPAARSGELLIGDAILSANGINLKEVMHNEAVQILSNLNGDVNLRVFFVVPENESDCEDTCLNNNTTYSFFEDNSHLKKLPK